MAMGKTPILILKEGTKRDKGKDAQYNNIMAARAIADAVRSTLGPRGMDKMLVDSMGDVVITNDGVTILKEIDVEHPAAKMLVEVAKTQDEECGDGTTTAVILAGELLKKAVDLIDANIHPTIITTGYSMAATKALEVLDTVADERRPQRHARPCVKIAKTAMMGKSVVGSKEHHGRSRRRGRHARSPRRPTASGVVDMDNIQVVKKHGRLHRRHRAHRGHHRGQGAGAPGHAQEGQEGQDRPARRRPGDQEDRDRRQDRDHRPHRRCRPSSTRRRACCRRWSRRSRSPAPTSSSARRASTTWCSTSWPRRRSTPLAVSRRPTWRSWPRPPAPVVVTKIDELDADRPGQAPTWSRSARSRTRR